MKIEATAKETEYEIGKYIFSLLEKNGILTHEQYLTLRDSLIDVYDPVIGELERGLDYEYPQN